MAAYAYHARVLGYTDEEVNNFFYRGLFAVGEDADMEDVYKRQIDYQRGAKIAGNGAWLYRGWGARMEWALLNFFVKMCIRDREKASPLWRINCAFCV